MNPHFDFKVVVAGPFAAGKTTMITAISDQNVVGTEAPTTGEEAAVKATTTVGMEYGTLSAASDEFSVELNVYGVPGQERFQFMWDIVGVGMEGLFLLVDGAAPATWRQSANVGAYFQRRFASPVVVGVNRAADRPDIVAAVEAEIPIEGASYIGFDATDRGDARDALVELLLFILDEMPEDDPNGDLADDERLIEDATAARHADERDPTTPKPTAR